MVILFLSFSLASPAQDSLQGASYPAQQFVTVAPDVKLEVLDWGGSGRNLVLLAGINSGRTGSVSEIDTVSRRKKGPGGLHFL
jgi:hypothetical protein